VRSFNTGPAGMLMMVIGLLLAGSSAWTAIYRTSWRASVPSILIGLSLAAIGYSLVARARKARSRSDRSHSDQSHSDQSHPDRRSDRANGDEL
jgi:hypothetical protein